MLAVSVSAAACRPGALHSVAEHPDDAPQFREVAPGTPVRIVAVRAGTPAAAHVRPGDLVVSLQFELAPGQWSPLVPVFHETVREVLERYRTAPRIRFNFSNQTALAVPQFDPRQADFRFTPLFP